MGSPVEPPGRVRLRPAMPDDMHSVWEWRNHPDVRRVSLTREEIPLEHHARWYAAQLESPDVVLCIIETGARWTPCGQVRLNRLPSGGATVSIGLAPEHQGRGLGPAALNALRVAQWRPQWASRLYAVIRLDNQASRRAFEAAGFAGPATGDVAVVGSLEPGTGVWVEQSPAASRAAHPEATT